METISLKLEGKPMNLRVLEADNNYIMTLKEVQVLL